MDKADLNIKLAGWVGLKRRECIFPGAQVWYDLEFTRGVPDFTASLDTCFKLLIPRLDHWDIWNGVPRVSRSVRGSNNAEVWLGCSYGHAYSEESAALALCFAVEKLIDNETGLRDTVRESRATGGSP